MEPHHRRCYMPVAPLLWRPVSSPCMHAGVLVGPGRERWGIGCRRRRELPDPRSGRGPHPRDGRRARMPGRLDPSSAAVDLEVDEAAGKAAVPRAPDLGGERVRPPDSAPYLDPSFQNTAPPSQPAQHNEDTRFPLLFWTLYSPWTLLLYYFCWIKASPRPDATPTVSVVCSSRHTLLNVESSLYKPSWWRVKCKPIFVNKHLYFMDKKYHTKGILGYMIWHLITWIDRKMP